MVAFGSEEAVIARSVVIRPMELLLGLLLFVNHSAPSGPAVIPSGLLMPVPM